MFPCYWTLPICTLISCNRENYLVGWMCNASNFTYYSLDYSIAMRGLALVCCFWRFLRQIKQWFFSRTEKWAQKHLKISAWNRMHPPAGRNLVTYSCITNHPVLPEKFVICCYQACKFAPSFWNEYNQYT